MAIDIGTPVHCVELNTGSGLTGTLLVSERDMHADLYNYTDFFFIKPEQPVYLRTSGNDIVSLYSNISAGPGTASRIIDRTKDTWQTTYHQKIASNIVVVGYDQWQTSDRVKRAHFKVNHIDHLLRHRKKMAALSKSRFPREEHFLLYRDKADGMTLSAWYAASYNIELESPSGIWPTFEIEFDEPLSIHDYLTHVTDYLFFWSFCLGVKLAPHDIVIDRLSLDEMRAAVKAHAYAGSHRVHYVWPEDELERGDANGFGSPVHAYEDEALAGLRACVAAWMNRASIWHKPYGLMMQSLALRHTVSAERLINACRWLEEIPSAQSQSALTETDMQAIAAAAGGKAVELGHPEAIRERIESAVKWVRSETSGERFARLVACVEDRFGSGILPPNAVQHLTRAIRFRGRVAHGHFEAGDDAESQAFYKSTCAVEALCLLLTAMDLPIPEQGLKNMGSHPVVQGYYLAYE